MNDRGKEMILIIDDNPQSIKLLGNILDSKGYSTAVAMNGTEALKFLENEIPDLILLDIMMPGMDGFEVCRSIKMNKNARETPVIFLTAKREIDDLVRGFEVGGVDYVTKPFNSNELLIRVKTHLDLKKARDEIRRLKGIIPICCNCKKIRDDKGFWEQVEIYIESHSDAEFSHGICPECTKELYGNLLHDEEE
jgi:DNA-binding response OmpR family regulator